MTREEYLKIVVTSAVNLRTNLVENDWTVPAAEQLAMAATARLIDDLFKTDEVVIEEPAQ